MLDFEQPGFEDLIEHGSGVEGVSMGAK